MKRFKTLSLLLTSLISLPVILYAQDDINLSTYNQSEVVNGFPTSSYGKKIKLPFLTNPAFVSIAPKGDFEEFFIVWEDYSSKKVDTWIVKEEADSSYTASKLYFRKIEPKESHSLYYEQDTVKTAEYKQILALIWERENDSLYHRWSGKVKRSKKLIKKDETMSEFTITLLDGGKYKYHPDKDKIVVVNWWQTTCIPCLEEIPGLNKLVNKYRDNERVEFLAIAWNKKEDVNKFLQERSFKYRQGLYNKKTAQLFGRIFPRNVIINSNGKIVYNTLGGSEDQWKEIDQALSGLIEQ